MQWASTQDSCLSEDYNLVLATLLINLPSLRELIPKLATVPTLLYFHENQLACPGGRKRHDNIEPPIVPLSPLCVQMLSSSIQPSIVTPAGRGSGSWQSACQKDCPRGCLRSSTLPRCCLCPWPVQAIIVPTRRHWQQIRPWKLSGIIAGNMTRESNY